MGWFAWSIEFMVWAGLGFAFVVTYLKVNKVWIRRYDRNVADSISVTAVVLGLVFNTLPSFVKFTFIEPDFAQAGKEGVKLLAAGVFFAIGIGLWARRGQRRGVFGLIRRAFKLEAREAADLARAFVRPVGADTIIRILEQVASLDAGNADRKRRFIDTFARAWQIDLDDDPVRLRAGVDVADREQLFIGLRQNVSAYLRLHPPQEQAGHLLDVLRVLADLGEQQAPEELGMLAEVEGLLNHYLRRKQSDEAFDVIVVPQSDARRQAIQTILTEARPEQRNGGEVFVVDRYYSKVFAGMICRRYREMGFFTAVDPVATKPDS